MKWFNNEKGFGFIAPDGGGADLFAHHTEIQGTGYRSLDEGAKVAFEPKQGPKGLQASQIRKL
ncbi:Cold shock protein CspA [Cupriavidus basilensis]|uniref:Cold shock protein CspA n=1 Tax=Cupriavidus basilensis TaxID=68895 RepID=A0A0C4YPM1_9BURK|nr:Cold shock protein CspA [Cupriavidus basilensis]